jgi:beta-barrel assembly-enhancing protease
VTGILRNKSGCRYHITVKSIFTLTASAPELAPRARPRRRLAPVAVAALGALLLASSVSVAQTGSALPTAKIPNLPTLGDTARADLSPIMERKLGEEIMSEIRRDKDYLDDAPLLEYLNTLGDTLVSAQQGARGETGQDFFFFAVRDPMLNAFALPGGFIAAHSALLLAAQTESELASVLAHEIGHVTQRHIARSIGQQRQDALIPLAAMILAALASRAGGDASMAVFSGGQGLAIQRQINFTREAEREADRIGFQIMGEAGFDTSGMVAFFGRMQSAGRSYSDLTPAYLRTHPLTSERIADIQARIREQPFKQRRDSLEFQLARARVRVLQDESTHGLAEAASVFAGQVSAQSRQLISAAHYGLAFVSLKKGSLDKAQSELDAARAALESSKGATFSSARLDAPSPMLASLGLAIKLAPGQPGAVAQRALKDAEAAHQQFPLSRGIAHQYAEAMIGAGKLEQAARYLRDQVQLYRGEPKLHELLARTYARQGKQALQHIALAESYNLSGSVLSALDQLTIARKTSDATFYEMAIIDAREREWQARRREELKEKK